MKTYHTSNSRDGLHLPSSGFVLGKMAEALKLKWIYSDGFQGASAKMVQRYFKGDNIDPKVVVLIRTALIDALAPQALSVPVPRTDPMSMRELLGSGLSHYLNIWDKVAAEVNANSYAMADKEMLPVPALRLLALDMGLRYGAWLALRDLQMGEPPAIRPAWIDGPNLGVVITQHLEATGTTVEKLAEKVGFSVQSVNKWKSGRSLPTKDSAIPSLAAALATDGEAASTMELKLRLMIAFKLLRLRFTAVCGQKTVDDILSAMFLTAHHVLSKLMLPLRDERVPSYDLRDVQAWRRKQQGWASRLPDICWDVMLHGGRGKAGRHLAVELAGMCDFRQEVEYDFLALRTDWIGRIAYWLKEFGSLNNRVGFVTQHGPRVPSIPSNKAAWMAEAKIKATWLMAGFHEQMERFSHYAVVELPPFEKAMNRVVRAERDASVYNWRGATDHMAHAVNHWSGDAGLWFTYAAFLSHVLTAA